MGRKFKLGDKVRFIEPKTYCSYTDPRGDNRREPKVGDVGVVTGYTKGGAFVIVRLDTTYPTNGRSGDGGWRFVESWLELVEPAPRFKVGDTVKVVGYEGTPWHGKVGTIKEVGKFGRPAYNVRFGEFPWEGGFYEDEIEHSAPKPKFAVGQRVKVANVNGKTDHPIVGWAGRIENYNAKSAWPYRVRFDNGAPSAFGESELIAVPDLTWQTPAYRNQGGHFARIEGERLDELVEDAIQSFHEQQAKGEDDPTAIVSSGDVLVYAWGSKVRVYRLERYTNV